MIQENVSRRGFLALGGAAAFAASALLAGCTGASSQAGSDAGSSAAGSASAEDAATSLKGVKLTFVGDDAFAPYRQVKVAKDGSTTVEGLDIDVADELARRLGFTYTFEPLNPKP